MSEGREYFSLSMDEDQIKNLVRLCDKTEAEILLMSKEMMVNLLNEEARRGFAFKPCYPELPAAAIQIDKLHIPYTKTVPLVTGVFMREPASSHHPLHPPLPPADLLLSSSSKTIPLPSSSSSSSSSSFSSLSLSSKDSTSGLSTRLNSLSTPTPPPPPPSSTASFSLSSSSTASSSSSAGVTAGVAAGVAAGVTAGVTAGVMGAPGAPALETEATKAAHAKSSEFSTEIGKKCQEQSLPEKKKTLSEYKKKYNVWIEKYISSFYEKHCGTTDDLELIGMGNAASRLKYTLETVTHVAAALKRALRVQIKIPCIDPKPMTLLTLAKEGKLNACCCQLLLQYEFYYRYVDKNKGTVTEEEVERLRVEGEAEIKKLKSNIGAKKNIAKRFALFHATLSSKGTTRVGSGGRGMRSGRSGRGKGSRTKRGPKKSSKGGKTAGKAAKGKRKIEETSADSSESEGSDSGGSDGEEGEESGDEKAVSKKKKKKNESKESEESEEDEYSD